MQVTHRELRTITRAVAFRCQAPHAHRVHVVLHPSKGGPTTMRPMHKTLDGHWHATIELPRGRYLYRFLVDGVARLDPTARGSITDDHGGTYSIREVGH
jgi:1,4-alpha-glucan branching enzyme